MPKKPSRKYLVKKLDTLFSLYIRLKSADKYGNVKCYTCNTKRHYKDYMQCGHFISRRHYITRWKETNAKPQCYSCNVGNQGNVGSEENTQPSLTSGSDRVQINVATSTSALSGLIDAAEGLDSLHLDGLFASTTSSEDLKLDGMDPKITSQMISTNGGGYFDLNNNYAEINLPSGLSGEVHVWTQTPEFYNGNEPFDTLIGIRNTTTGELTSAINDDGDPSTSYYSGAINNLVTANDSTRSSNDNDSFLSFYADSATSYSVIVADSAQNGNPAFGGYFDLYAVSNVNSVSEALILNETIIGNMNGAFIDFMGGDPEKSQSAWVTSFGGNGGSVGFTIDGFEKIELTDFADYVLLTDKVGKGVGSYDATYFTTSQSGMLIDPGTSIGGGVDKLSVHSDSNLFLSYEESSQDSSGVGVSVDIDNHLVTVQGGNVDTRVEKYDGTGLLVDYLETTNFADTVVNNSSSGMVVNLAKNYESSSFDKFTGSDTDGLVDVLDARLSNKLDFSTYDDSGTEWIEISGYNELNPKTEGDLVYYLTSSNHGVSDDGFYIIRHETAAMSNSYFATRVGGNATDGYYPDGNSEQSTSITDIANLTSSGRMPDPDAIETKARIKDVEVIMVRDQTIPTITDDDQIWQSLATSDVDFYVDMSEIYGSSSQPTINGLGSGAVDNFGEGYDVQTSAQVNKFGDDENLRVFYDGNHEDFKDENDRMDTSTPGSWSMVQGNTANGSDWANQVATATNGGGGSFFIVVGGKKIAVKHSGTEWIADNTSLSIAQNVSMGQTSAETIKTDFAPSSEAEETFIATIADRYGLPKLADSTNYSFSNEIYLNATEQEIEEVLENSGSLTSETSFNFGFYTKVLIGDATVNLKIVQTDTTNSPHLFELRSDDLDLMVESVYNTVETEGESVDSGSVAGNFVKVDDSNDIAMGNGGDDTYVINSTGGTALEYGDINTEIGGFDNSKNDSINFANVNSITKLEFTRDSVRNEDTDNSLVVNEVDETDETDKTVIFDNFNQYFDFRRIEFLTIDDASNNNEIFEISVDGNSGTDGDGDNLTWDNEIVVANNQGDTIYADGGTDVLVGGAGNDTFNIENVVGASMNEHDAMSHVYIKNFSDGDSIAIDSGDSHTDTVDDGVITIKTSNDTYYQIFTDEETLLKSAIDAQLSVV